MHETRPSGQSKQEIFEMLFRHKRKIVLLPLLVFAVATVVVLFFPRTYGSEAKLLLRVGRESVAIDPTADIGQQLNLQQNGRDSEVKSAIDMLASRGMAERVIAELGPDYISRGGPPGSGKPTPVYDALMAPARHAIQLIKNVDKVSPKERAIIEFLDSLAVDSERYSAVIELKYETASARGAQEILETLIDVFQDEYLRLYRNPDSRRFFAEQSDLLQTRLAEASQALRDAKNRMGLASVEGRRSSYEGQISSIESAIYGAEQELASATAKIEDLQSQLANLPERLIASKTSKPNAGADLLREQLYALQVKQIDLKARFSDDHPLVKAVSSQVADAQDIIDKQAELRHETVDDVNPIHRELSAELKKQQTLVAGLEARLRTLDEQKRLLASDLKQLNAHEVELAELERERTIAQTKYFAYTENFEQARIDEALQLEKISSMSLAQKATLQEKPVSPSKLITILGAMVLSLGGVISWVAISEKLNDTIRGENDAVRVLDTPVFGVIPNKPECARVLAR